MSVAWQKHQLLRATSALFLASLIALTLPANAQDWSIEFAKMPLRAGVMDLRETNVVADVLGAFQRNPAVKALVFMPGATDEFYFFHRAKVHLTNAAPTLLDVISAMTNQTLIRATMHGPLMVLHTDEDPLEPIIVIEDQKSADKFKEKKFRKQVLYNDRDWNYLHPILSFYLNSKVLPAPRSHDMYHFFRHSFAGFDLTDWEAMQAVAMAGKEKFTVKKNKVIFDYDTRMLAKPPAPPNFLMPTNQTSRP